MLPGFVGGVVCLCVCIFQRRAGGGGEWAGYGVFCFTVYACLYSGLSGFVVDDLYLA